MLERFVNKVYNGNALDLLRVIPTASVDGVLSDAMYGTAANCRYDWGPGPAKGDPVKHWQYHEPIYKECLRVLKPGGVLAWGQGAKFYDHFPAWFGGHRVWPLTRFAKGGVLAVGNIWVVQNREQQPIEFPQKDSLVICSRAAQAELKSLHPCPKPVEEMAWLIETLTKPGQIVLDCFCGLGSTLVAAEQLGRRWIGCDRSRTYCQVAMKRLAELLSKSETTQAKEGLIQNRPSDQRTIAKNTLSFSCSKSMEYLRTPPDIWENLRKEFAFSVDVCASHDNHLLPRYFTVQEDGLQEDWTGEVVYCHPLFDSHIGHWVEKAYRSKCTTVMLLPAGTHTRYFHNFIYNNPKAEVRFLQKPTKGFRFGCDDGSPDDHSRIGYIRPLMVVIFRNQP